MDTQPIDLQPKTSDRDLMKFRISQLNNCPTNEERSLRIGIIVKERLQELLGNENAPSQINLGSIYEDFIQPTTEVKQSLMIHGVKLDDFTIYEDLLEKVYQAQKLIDGDVGRVIPVVLLNTIADYFGSYTSTPENSLRKKIMFNQNLIDDPSCQSIANYKDQGVAECVERAATLHNMLKFLGYNSIYVSSECNIDGIRGNHAFVLLVTKNGASILDYTNPVVIKDEEGMITNYFPCEYKLSMEQLNEFRNGKTISFVHQNRQRNKENTYKFIEESSREYGGPGI